ncbi:hypothetical protein ACFQQB_60480 [Nonomuraea rubra]|uniref:hypothetical protein n=1 Tax=Nonomuraea rubra TaxID=46180 RepID=UPI0031E85C09
MRIERGEIHDAVATITCDVGILQGLVFARRDLSDAMRAGEAVVLGDAAALQRFLRSFEP